MNYKMIRYLLGLILLIEAALMVFPAIVSLIYSENVMPFLITIAILIVLSVPCVLFKPANKKIYAKDGFVVVAVIWLLMSAFGALPFVISGAIPNFTDAFFETVSGFTTTGATILTEIESLPKGILFWRSFTHWVGGMGVLVFMMAILPSSGGGQNMHLMRAEVPGPTKGKIVPKMQQTALILYGIYVILTLAEFVALLFCKMSVYDALVNSFATAGTGGFSVLNASVGGYNNPAAEWVIAVFMFVFGINFNIYYFVLIGKMKDVLKNEELKVYAAVCFGSVAMIAINTAGMFERVGDCIRTAFFQVTSIMSTSGFSTVNFDLWPEFSKSVLVILMVVGACAGSTAGGLKVSRIIIVLKGIACHVRQLICPHSVNKVRLDGEVVPDDTVRSATCYISVYVLFIAITTLLISIDGYSLETNFTATLTCINNIGPGLADVGPVGNFSGYSVFSKILLSFNMLLGRLEIMPMLVFLSPLTWRKH